MRTFRTSNNVLFNNLNKSPHIYHGIKYNNFKMSEIYIKYEEPFENKL